MTYEVVLSLRGRDKGGLFAVIGGDGDYALIADGRTRPLQKPKKKRWKHLKAISRIIIDDPAATNRQLYSAIRKIVLPESAEGGFELVQG